MCPDNLVLEKDNVIFAEKKSATSILEMSVLFQNI